MQQIEDQKAILKSAWVSNITAKIKYEWGPGFLQSMAEDELDWFVQLKVTQNKEGKVLDVQFKESNVGNSSKATAFKNSVERAVYKASPLPISPDASVWEKYVWIKFSAK